MRKNPRNPGGCGDFCSQIRPYGKLLGGGKRRFYFASVLSGVKYPIMSAVVSSM